MPSELPVTVFDQIWLSYFYNWAIGALSKLPMYNTHKTFMNSLGCRGYDPYGAIISTGHCQKTLGYKSAK